jgi:polar amino acid transport system substrate-binding protein
MRPAMRIALTAACLALLDEPSALPRSLDAISASGTLALCAHPNALPFASRRGDVPGFQVEIAEALAARLGVTLMRHWVINKFQYRRAGCDLVLDAIADEAALAEAGLRLSRPYHRSGVRLAVRDESSVSSLASLGPQRRVGVQVGSIAAMTLNKRGIETSPFVFEDEILDALATREIEAAAVTPAAIGWFNLKHPGARLRRIDAFENDPNLNWNVSVGLVSPDERLRQRMDAVLEALLADGTIARIYARYGIELRAPE